MAVCALKRWLWPATKPSCQVPQWHSGVHTECGKNTNGVFPFNIWYCDLFLPTGVHRLTVLSLCWRDEQILVSSLWLGLNTVHFTVWPTELCSLFNTAVQFTAYLKTILVLVLKMKIQMTHEFLSQVKGLLAADVEYSISWEQRRPCLFRRGLFFFTFN